MIHLNHEQKIKALVNQIKANSGSKTPLDLTKKSVSHFVPIPGDSRDKLPKIDLGDLNSIISLEAEKTICVSEPGITFCDLVPITLKHRLIPAVVPELKTITVGGAISGCSIESMSYKYGGFHDSSLEYEVVTGKGDVIACSPENNPEIFHMMHGSYGTLGIITKVKFRLLPGKPFVHLKYEVFEDLDSYWEFLISTCEREKPDFIDSIIHGKDKFVVCIGNMVDNPPFTSSYNWLKVYYRTTSRLQEDYLSIFDYFFRYDADCHWSTKSLPLLETLPVRLLLGKILLGSTNLISWSKRLRFILNLKKRPDLLVDVFIPSRNFKKFFRWYEKELSHYPLWIVPYRAPGIYPWIADEFAKKMDEHFFIDCAVYGMRNSRPDIDYSELIEKKVFEFGGLKTLISRNHYDRETFWKIYSRERYESVKAITDPNNLFGNLYDRMMRG